MEVILNILIGIASGAFVLGVGWAWVKHSIEKNTSDISSVADSQQLHEEQCERRELENSRKRELVYTEIRNTNSEISNVKSQLEGVAAQVKILVDRLIHGKSTS